MWEASGAEPWGGGRKRPSPSQVGMGALGPRPELLRRRRCSPHPPPSPGRLPTERPHSLSRGRWTPCLFVWSQRPRRGAAPSSSSAPGPTPPPRPAPLFPRASINQSLLRAHVTRRAGPGSAGHVTWAAGPPGACSPAACAVLRRRLPCGGASPPSAVPSCDSRVRDEAPIVQVLGLFFFSIFFGTFCLTACN